MISRIYQRTKELADVQVPLHRNVVTLIGWVISVFSLGFIAGLGFPTAVHTLFGEDKTGLISPDGMAIENTCQISEEIRRAQSEYANQVMPLRNEWLRLTAGLTRNNLLTEERKNTTDAADRINNEIDQIEERHERMLKKISENCL